MIKSGVEIQPPAGRLGVLLPGLGAVSTTFVAGVELIKKGLGKPVGSLTQLGTIRLGKRTDDRTPAIKDFVPLAEPADLVFGAWDFSRTTRTRLPSRRRCWSLLSWRVYGRNSKRSGLGRPCSIRRTSSVSTVLT